MATLKEIKAKYKKLHDELTANYYSGDSGLTKEEFDQKHGKIWTDMEAKLKTASDYVEPAPVRDLATEIDELRAEIVLLKSR